MTRLIKTINFLFDTKVTLTAIGEHGGSVVEHRTPEGEDQGFSKPTSAVFCPCCFLEVPVIPRKRWLRPDMT